ncbi:MAG: PhzF family phenazine biosynthesis protein [Desulfovibrio sp.]|nr:PhzF family phenazine biosynthesis protein [Desulfovibrio sp.]
MRFYLVDVFAETKYAGNQLAVFCPRVQLKQAEMQRIAREINFSETTFICSEKQENGGYAVRIFTPDVEIPFAGHPTLGTAYIIRTIFEQANSNLILLNYASTSIPVRVTDDIYTMSHDAPTFCMTYSDSDIVAEMVNISVHDINTEYPIQLVSTGLPSFIVPLNSPEALSRCSIQHPLFRKFLDSVYKCNILLFAPISDSRINVRVFLDDSGFLEDAATGSANGNLAAYILHYNLFGQDAVHYEVFQGIEMGRPSLLHIAASRDGLKYDIRVGGKVRLIASGDWA